MAEAISRLAKDESLRTSLRRKAGRRAVSEYGLERMIARYRELYAGAASSRQAAACAPRGKRGRAFRPRVVMLGPAPPLVGGMATVLSNLSTSALPDQCALAVLNNGKTTPEGRSLLVGIVAQLRLFGQIVRTILKHRAQIVHIHTCEGFTFWRDCLHLFAAHLLGSVGVVHVHGGRFDEFIANLGPVGKALLRQALQTAGAVVVLSQDWLDRLTATLSLTWHRIARHCSRAVHG